MNILGRIQSLIDPLGIPVETGVYSGEPVEEYLVITPLTDQFAVYADNHPQFEVQEARLSLFSKKNYLHRKRQLERIFLQAGFTITDRRYIGHEDDTGYHHVAMDVAKEIPNEEEA